MSEVRFLVGDVFERLAELEDDSIDAVITSPPYWGLRRYTDNPGEIGTSALGAYLADLWVLGRRLERVLKPAGVWWLNLGDTAIGSGGAGGDYSSGGSRDGRPRYKQGHSGLSAGGWGLIPWRTVIGLQNHGWLVRSVVVWDKQQPRREDAAHVKRPLVQWEPIFLLSRTTKIRWFDDGGDVWQIPPARGKSGHQAPWPRGLVERMIRASTEPGDCILDPFVGSGTTLAVAHAHGRDAIGIDLDERNAELARGRLGMFLEVS